MKMELTLKNLDELDFGKGAKIFRDELARAADVIEQLKETHCPVYWGEF